MKEKEFYKPEAKVNKQRFTTYLPDIMVEQIRDLSTKTRIPQASLMEEAALDLLTKYYGKFVRYEK